MFILSFWQNVTRVLGLRRKATMSQPNVSKPAAEKKAALDQGILGGRGGVGGCRGTGSCVTEMGAGSVGAA